MQEKPKNRDWVKNAAIIFLAVLLVLTFFSNTIMNRSLPEVATQGVADGSIVARVRGTGTVEANSNTQVKMDRTRVIRSVLVKVGQQVQAGDVLFTLGEGASEEIEAAEDKLQSLQASYNKIAATMPDPSYGADQRRIEMANEAYNEAVKREKSILDRMERESEDTHDSQERRDQAVTDALARLKAAQLLKDTAEELYDARIKEKEEELERIKEKQDAYETNLQEITSKQDLLNEITNAQIEKSILENDVINLQVQIDELQRLIDNISSEEDPYLTQLQDLQNQMSTLEAQLAEIEAQEESDQAQIDSLIAQIDNINTQILQLQETINSLDPNAVERQALEQQIRELEFERDRLSYNLQATGMNDYNKAEINSQYTDVIERIKEIEDQVSTVGQNKEQLEAQRTALEQEKASKESSIISYSEYLAQYSEDDISALNDRLIELWDSSATPEEIEAAMRALANVSEADLDAANAYLEKCQLEYENIWAAKDPKMSDELRYAREQVRSAESNLLSLKQSLRDKIESNDRAAAGYNADLASLWQQIQRQQEKLADLMGGEEAQIKARVAGTIQTIDASPGDTKKKDDILATIEAPDMGYTLSFSVTNDQAARLRVGDTATVSNFYWGSEITATLNSIKIDQKKPQTNKLLTFDVDGNVTSGTQLTLSVGQKSANYDIIIPSSAVRTDANGTFVLKLESKNSPLGNRYLARRVPVEILASDDTNSAVSADLGNGDYVITTSSSPLKNGELVRLATSG